MACRLFGAKPLSEPMLPYCQLDPKDHKSMKFYFNFLFEERHLKMSSAKWQTLCLGLNVWTSLHESNSRWANKLWTPNPQYWVTCPEHVFMNNINTWSAAKTNNVVLDCLFHKRTPHSPNERRTNITTLIMVNKTTETWLSQIIWFSHSKKVFVYFTVLWHV